jgi:hypothetical protein
VSTFSNILPFPVSQLLKSDERLHGTFAHISLFRTDGLRCIQILMPFPELAPLIAVMGWDMHAGDVAARQDVLQRLWQQRTRAQQRQVRASKLSARPAEGTLGRGEFDDTRLWR